jgi:hypothetical protein
MKGVWGAGCGVCILDKTNQPRALAAVNLAGSDCFFVCELFFFGSVGVCFYW